MVTHFNTRLYPLIRTIRTISRLRGRAVGREGSDLSLPAAPVNRLLRRCFSGESKRLTDIALGRRMPKPSHGVSLMAVLRKSCPRRSS